jgi:hypothetical protein
MRENIERETPAVAANAPADRLAAMRSERICVPTFDEIVLRLGSTGRLASTFGIRAFVAVGKGDATCFLATMDPRGVLKTPD